MMGWGEVLKELLKSFAQLIRDIPIWAKVVLAFGIFVVVAVVVLVNLNLLVVYDVEVIETPRPGQAGPYNIWYETTQRETKTDDNGRAKLVLPTGLLERQENVIVVKKPVVNLGEDPPRIRYGFTSGFWQSQMVSFTLTCDFRKKGCELERAGQFQDIQEAPKRTTWLPGLGISWASAQSRDPLQPPTPELATPTIQTLQRRAPEGGYAEIRLTKFSLSPNYCKRAGPCPDTLFAEVEWNGFGLLFDGIKAAASQERNLVITADGQIRGDLGFAVVSTLLAERNNVLKVHMYSRGTASWTQQRVTQQTFLPTRPLDIIEAVVDFARQPGTPVKSAETLVRGRQGVLTATLESRVVTDRFGRTYEVLAGKGTQAEVLAKLKLLNEKPQLTFKGQPVVATVRPPLPGTAAWGLVLGVRDAVTGWIRTLFSEEEVKGLHTQLKGVAPAQLGPLKAEDLSITKLRALE